MRRALTTFFLLATLAGSPLAHADSGPSSTVSLKGRLAALGLDSRGGSPFSVKGALVSLGGASVSVNVTDGTFAGKQVSVTVVPNLTPVVRVGGGSPAAGDGAFASGKICKAADGQRLVAAKVYTKAAGGDSKTQPVLNASAPTSATTTTTTTGSGDAVPFACDGKGGFELKGLVAAASADAVAVTLEGRQVSLALVAGWTQVTRQDHSISAGDLVPGERLYAVGRACGSGDGARLVARKLVSLGVEPAHTEPARTDSTHTETTHTETTHTEPAHTETAHTETSGTTTHA